MDADGLACMAGQRNKLAVIDICARGAQGERLLAEVQRRFGKSRFETRTGRQGFTLRVLLSGGRRGGICETANINASAAVYRQSAAILSAPQKRGYWSLDRTMPLGSQLSTN